MKRKKLDALYTEAKEQRKVWKGEGKDQRWKFKKDDGTLVAKTSEEKIKEEYLKYLETKSLESEKNTATFADLYSSWLNYKKEQVGTNKGQLNPSTFRRYQRDYERYIKATSFDKMLVAKITPIDIETFLKSMVTKHKLTKRCFTNISGYIKGAFFYARKRELIDKNPYELVDHTPIKGFCKVIVKQDEDRVLSNADMKKLIETLHIKQDSKKLYIQNYAIELATLTGMRVGELAALKWSCITDEVLEIKYSEHRLDYEDKTCEYYIGEPKNGKCRNFPMNNEIKDLFERIKTVQAENGITDEFVFANVDGRINSHTISCAMSRRCEDAGIDKRSIHAIRRTVSSHLRTKLSRATVANMLGHLPETKVTSLNEMYKEFKDVA